MLIKTNDVMKNKLFIEFKLNRDIELRYRKVRKVGM